MKYSHLDVNDIAVKGNVVLPDRVAQNAVVTVKEGKITEVLENGECYSAIDTVDAGESYIIPGCIDAHVHCFSSPEEGFEKAGRAAAAGGVTTIVEMPYDAGGMVCTRDIFLNKKQRLEMESIIDIALLATVKTQDGLNEIPLLAEEGACGFKISMFNTDPVRFPRIDDARMLEVFEEIAKTGLPVGIHAENDEIVSKFVEKYKDKGLEDPRAHCWSRPMAAESAAVLTALELAYWTGVKLHIYHASFSRIFELVEFYRSKGTKITAETCTHYLTLNEEDMPVLKAKGKINPPLRKSEENGRLWEKLSLGSVDFITSDHAPWTMERKSNPDIFANASGAPGVETLLPVMFSKGVTSGKISICQLVKLLCENPAAVFGLNHCKGKIATGMDADLVIIDPKKSYKLDESKLHSNAGWSPYNGWELQGNITHTFLRGKLIYNGEVLAKPGYGNFIHAKHR